MKWNSFNLVSPAIKKTQERLFPFNFKEWFKLTIISLLAGGRGGSGNFNSGGSGGSTGGTSGGNWEQASAQIRDFVKKYWIFGALIFSVIFIIGTILSYIQSVFTFIFIDSLVDNKAKFTFRKNHSKGVSLFFIKFFITIATIIVIGALAFPYIYNFMIGNPVISTVGIPYIIFSIIALIVYFILLWIIFLFLYDFAVPYTYVKGTSVGFSVRQTWKNILQNKSAVFVYWLARLVLGIAVAIIAVLIVILVLIAFGIIGLVIFGLGFLLYMLIGGALLFIILAVIFGIILVLAFLLAMGMVMLPFSVFSRYFELLNFEKLTDLTILKSTKKK